jgi:hypothetical protein
MWFSARTPVERVSWEKVEEATWRLQRGVVVPMPT